MQAFILAAGLGTRLRPITDNLPKALVKVAGKPLLQWNIEKLKAAGCTHIVINVHHFPDLIREFIQVNNNFGIRISVSDESDRILDTGGGLLKAARFFNPEEVIIAHNVDIISQLNLHNLIAYHNEHKALATLVVRNRSTQRYLIFNKNMRFTGWINRATSEIKPPTLQLKNRHKQLAFSGIHIINPKIFDKIKQSGKFSIIDTYIDLTGNNKIIGFEDTTDLWLDVGKYEELAEAEKVMKNLL